MNNLIASNFKKIKGLGKHSITLLLMTFILIAFLGCSKDQLIPRGKKIKVEGIVLEDCNGNVSQDKEVKLQYISSGCFGGALLSEETIVTDNDGYFKFEYREAVNYNSSTSYYHMLTIPKSTISISNPSGYINLYPNDTLMNAIINLKFKKTYTSQDTFYCQFSPSPKGIVEQPEQIQYFVGPFHDTTLIFKNLRIGNSNNVDKGKFHCGKFKWGIGKFRLNQYYTGNDGYFYLSHEPYAVNDSFIYYTDPLE